MATIEGALKGERRSRVHGVAAAGGGTLGAGGFVPLVVDSRCG
jgi:hypothetical protein